MEYTILSKAQLENLLKRAFENGCAYGAYEFQTHLPEYDVAEKEEVGDIVKEIEWYD